MAIITRRIMQLRDGSFIELSLDDTDTRVVTIRGDSRTQLAVKAIELHNAADGRYEFELRVDGADKFTARRFAIGQRRTFAIPNAQKYYWGNYRWEWHRIDPSVLRARSVGQPTTLTSGIVEEFLTSHTTASVSPAANALVLTSYATTTEDGTHTITDSLSGLGAWTEAGTSIFESPVRTSLHFSQATGSPGSGTITNTFSLELQNIAWDISELTGHDTSTPSSESASASSATGGDPSITLGGVTADNRTYMASGLAGALAVTAGSGETEHNELTGNLTLHVEFGNDAGTDATVNATSTGEEWSASASAMEIAAAAEGGGGFAHSQGVIVG